MTQKSVRKYAFAVVVGSDYASVQHPGSEFAQGDKTQLGERSVATLVGGPMKVSSVGVAVKAVQESAIDADQSQSFVESSGAFLGCRDPSHDSIMYLLQGLCGKPLSRRTDGCSGGWGYAAGGEPKQIAIRLAGEQTKTDNHPEQVQVTDPPLCPARDLLIEQGLNLLGTEKVKHPAEPIGCEGILSCVVHVAFPLRNWV
jgi:hypothetical protein